MRVDIGDGVRLFVDIDGLGLVPDGAAMVERPTVVLLHGGPSGDHSRFKYVESPDLTDIAQVVFYDHRGNGRSDRCTSAEWNLDVWADDVVRLCDALGITKPVVIGESFGGFVAQRYLARHPDHADRVVLSCTAPRMDVDLIAAAFGRLGGEEAAEIARNMWSGRPGWVGRYVERCIPLYSVGPLDPLLMGRAIQNPEVSEHFSANEQLTMDLAPGLAAATCPVLVVGGELDPVCPIEMSEQIVAALVNADVTFERLPGASHADVGHRAGPVIRRFITG